MRPLRIPYRGPMQSAELASFSDALDAKLRLLLNGPDLPVSDIPLPELDREMILLLDRLHKGGFFVA